MCEPTGRINQWRGHAMELDDEGRWIYSDTRGLVAEDTHRACGKCNLPNRMDGHDACLGELPSVTNACCGHGELGAAYVNFSDGRRGVYGKDALAVLRALVDPSMARSRHLFTRKTEQSDG